MKTILVSFIATVCLALIILNTAGHTYRPTGFENINYTATTATNSIRLIFAGDVIGHDTLIKGAWRDGGDSCYNFIHSFQWVKEYISSADIAIANLEVTLAGAPYSGYPAFSSPVALAVALQDAGFDLLVTANNHILDRGATGLERTVDVLDSLGIAHTGIFKNLGRRKTSHPLIMEKNGFRLAFLNYTYGTNMSTAKPPVIVNYLDTLQMAADLYRARELNADYIIACVHWGEEYQSKENETQRIYAEFLARHGCNLIVGSHPHVVQPVKKIAGNTGDSTLVAYSLGNFISNQYWRYSDGGITLEVTLTKTDNGAVNLQSCRYESFWVHRSPDKGAKTYRYRIIPVIDYLNHPDRYPALNNDDERKLIRFYNDTKALLNQDFGF